MKKQIIEILSEICPGIDFETETALIDFVTQRWKNNISHDKNNYCT